MSRWRKALIAATVGVAASAALSISMSPGHAEASLVAKYNCTGGVAGTEGVQLEALITPKLAEGGMLNVGWSLKYLGNRRFGSPGFFAKGSQLNLEGIVDIVGAWNGQLRPKGGKAQDALVPGAQLVLPDGLSDAGSVQRPGTIRVTPGALAVRFTPAKGEVMVNNHKLAYPGGTWTRENTEAEFGDYLNDLHKTADLGAVAKLDFTGTQVSYISRRERDLSKIRILLDGHPVTDGLVEPGKDANGTPMTGTKAQETLWTSPELPYGPHSIEIENAEAGTAYVDAVKVVTGELTEPPLHDQASCTLINDPGSIDITVPGATPTSPTPTNSVTPTTTGTPTSTPTTTTSSPGHVGTPTATATNGMGQVIVLPRATGTKTVTATASPTSTKYVKAQVAKTPKGGVETGEAPEQGRQPYALIAGGSVLLMGSATGGLLLRRRRAEHAGGMTR
ncbi:hypothetical protein ACIBHX_41205 [Nonomuraea sp. NPDC050536]|uniref:hypothetical protein n=1 Tax=Nonomuraea sp. NPDC050536 TaxID=3364366 RepID=UPI0037C66A22